MKRKNKNVGGQAINKKKKVYKHSPSQLKDNRWNKIRLVGLELTKDELHKLRKFASKLAKSQKKDEGVSTG